jgi:hypothetical protein
VHPGLLASAALDGRQIEQLGRFVVGWTPLYLHHADLVLNGHIHNYQRFAQLNPSGQTAADGIREVIAGTGGESLGGLSSSTTPQATVRLKTFGYLRLILHPDSYDGTFVKADGSTGDTFSGSCH